MGSGALVDSFRNRCLAGYVLRFTLGLGGARRARRCFGCGSEGLSGTTRGRSWRFNRKTEYSLIEIPSLLADPSPTFSCHAANCVAYICSSGVILATWLST